VPLATPRGEASAGGGGCAFGPAPRRGRAVAAAVLVGGAGCFGATARGEGAERGCVGLGAEGAGRGSSLSGAGCCLLEEAAAGFCLPDAAAAGCLLDLFSAAAVGFCLLLDAAVGGCFLGNAGGW